MGKWYTKFLEFVFEAKQKGRIQMDAKCLEVISWAGKPRTQNWRKWVRLLTSLEKPVPISQLLEFRPPIDLECEPLLGQMVQVGDIELKKRANQLPALSVRMRIFLKGIAIVKTFREVDDLKRLVVYRRQVTNIGPCPRVDRSLYLLISQCFPKLSEETIEELADRMPPRSEIKMKLKKLAEEKKQTVMSLPLAAE